MRRKIYLQMLGVFLFLQSEFCTVHFIRRCEIYPAASIIPPIEHSILPASLSVVWYPASIINVLPLCTAIAIVPYNSVLISSGDHNDWCSTLANMMLLSNCSLFFENPPWVSTTKGINSALHWSARAEYFLVFSTSPALADPNCFLQYLETWEGHKVTHPLTSDKYCWPGSNICRSGLVLDSSVTLVASTKRMPRICLNQIIGYVTTGETAA